MGINVVFVVIAFVIGIIIGNRIAIAIKAKRMLEKMDMGMLVINLNDDSTNNIECRFKKSPREMIGLDYILLEVKIRQ